MYLFAFRSRTQAMKLYDLLRMSGVMCEIINTPHQIAASCGLSVCVQSEDFARAQEIFDYYGINGAVGVFIRDKKLGDYRRYS